MGDVYTNPPQSRNEAILESTITGSEYTAPPQSRIEDLLLELKNKIENTANVYGVEWDGEQNSKMIRTDNAAFFPDPKAAISNGNGSSPFDSCYPWSVIGRVEDPSVGVLVGIPKYWYKWTRNGKKMKLQIADKAIDGFLVSPAHADRGDGKGERNIVYVGAYHCASNYKSLTGNSPVINITRPAFRSVIHDLGSDIWQYDFAMHWTILMLYIVEYAEWNSQKVIGYGCGNDSGRENSGATDSMIYHTGTNASSFSTYGHTRYRYIEDLWGNVMDWCDGIYFSGTSIYAINNPADFSDTTGGINIGTRGTENGVIKSWTNPTEPGFEYALYPETTETDATYSKYICDGYGYGSTGNVLRVGGNYYRDQGFGLFQMNGYNNSNEFKNYVGARIMKLP